ncbi:MAG: CtsR family transcriptional regulator [Christensenellaceae bacterium]|nr:CtsR family transcriptional regulator [Christensenellaceae bacterium]
MAILSDSIEQFIKQMMEEGMNMLNRNELAEYFDCAPSQINYVINTRFTPERGYMTESRRGGGGYIRVVRVNVSKNEVLAQLIGSKLGKGELSERESKAIASQLIELGLADKKQAKMLIAATSDKTLAVPAMVKDRLRCSIMRNMVLELLNEE